MKLFISFLITVAIMLVAWLILFIGQKANEKYGEYTMLKVYTVGGVTIFLTLIIYSLW